MGKLLFDAGDFHLGQHGERAEWQDCVLISDDLKASSLRCYGNEICETPNLDSLAEQSMIFDRAYCQGTWCLPAHASLMHSKYVGTETPS